LFSDTSLFQLCAWVCPRTPLSPLVSPLGHEFLQQTFASNSPVGINLVGLSRSAQRMHFKAMYKLGTSALDIALSSELSEAHWDQLLFRGGRSGEDGADPLDMSSASGPGTCDSVSCDSNAATLS